MNEITFEYLYNDTRYKVVCEYGTILFRPYKWKFTIQKQVEKKRLFRKSKMIWVEVDWLWCEEQCETAEKLKMYADKCYHDTIIKPVELIKKAMSITQPK